jgi:hypothetical protein
MRQTFDNYETEFHRSHRQTRHISRRTNMKESKQLKKILVCLKVLLAALKNGEYKQYKTFPDFHCLLSNHNN